MIFFSARLAGAWRIGEIFVILQQIRECMGMDMNTLLEFDDIKDQMQGIIKWRWRRRLQCCEKYV